MPKSVSRFAQLWLSWKALRLPWRKQFLIGHDLDGNTYWEFRDIRGHNDSATARWRRIVQYPRGTHHSDVKVPPQWHQWLRHTRREPPSLDEQRHELARQQQMRLLAAAADARWAGAKRVDSGPSLVLPQLPAEQSSQPQRTLETDRLPSATPPDSWKSEQPSRQKWQPQAWTPREPKQ